MRHHLPPPEQLSELVGLVYACAIDAERMPDLLHLLKRYLRGACAQIYSIRLPGGAVLESHISDATPLVAEANRLYVRDWSARDPRIKLLAAMPSGSVMRCHEHFNEAYVWGSEFYQDFFIPNGFRWAVAGLVHCGPARATVISAVRGPAATPFEGWTAEALRHLLPHFERASLIGSRLERQAAVIRSTTEMLSLLSTPCLFTDAAGRCLEANDAFRQTTERLALHVITGRVRFDHPDRQAQWETALWETQATGLGRSVHLAAADGRDWTVRLTPWDPPAGDGAASDRKMIMAVFDDQQVTNPANAEPVLARANLTRAELEVFNVMLKGLPAKAIAGLRGASVNTVRTQIVAILEKTGFKSQKELLASFGASSYGESGFEGSSSFHHTNE